MTRASHHHVLSWRVFFLLAALVAAFALAPAPASADSGTIKGRAATVEGSLTVLPLNLNLITLPANGTNVQLNLPLTVGAGADLGILGDLTIGISADSVRTECEGAPSASTVWSECTSRIEGLSIGASLELLGGLVTNNANIIEASVLESRSRSSAPGGSAQSSSSGTVITGLCVYANGSTCTTVNGQASVNVSVLGVITGNVQVFAQQSRASDGGASGSGLTVTMLGIDLSTILGSLVSVDIGVADSFVGDIAGDPVTPTPTAVPPTPTAVPPTATPSGPGQPTATPNPSQPTATATTPGQAPTATPTKPASNNPQPTATNTPVPFGPFAAPTATPQPQTPRDEGNPESNPTAAPPKPGTTPGAPPSVIPKPPNTGSTTLADSEGRTLPIGMAGALLIVVAAGVLVASKRSR